MTREDFLNLADTYGGNIGRWPEEVRSAAKDFKSSNSDFADQVLLQASELDKALESARIAPGTDILKARILSAAKSSTTSQSMPSTARPQGLRYRAVAALVAGAFVLGFTGANYLNGGSYSEEATPLIAESEWEDFADDYGMDEIYAWAGQDALP